MEDNYTVKKYLKENEKFFSEEYIGLIGQALTCVPSETAQQAMSVKLKNPSSVQMVSVFFGVFGIDRFMVGDYVYGIIKLASFGLFFIGWILDMIFIKKHTKEFNASKILSICFPGKIKKPTMASRVFHYAKNNPEQIRNLIQSSNNLKNTMYMH